MDAKTKDNLEQIDNSQETIDLIERWRNIVKPGIYRLSKVNGKSIMNRNFCAKKDEA